METLKETKQYMVDRVDNQINWFNLKAKKCKWHYYIFSFISILTSALTPVFVKECPEIAVVTSLISTVVMSLNNSCKFKEKWELYRTTVELLEREKAFYLYSTIYSYNDDKFIERIEDIICDSNKKWISKIHEKGDKKE